MQMPNQTQILAFSRHIPSFAAGAIFYAATFGVVSSGDATTANHAITQISDGVKDIMAGVSALIPIGMGAWAAVKASPLVQMLMGAHALVSGAADPRKMSPDDQKVVMEATEKLPKVAAVVTNDKTIAATTASPNIVSTEQAVIKN